MVSGCSRTTCPLTSSQRLPVTRKNVRMGSLLYGPARETVNTPQISVVSQFARKKHAGGGRVLSPWAAPTHPAPSPAHPNRGSLASRAAGRRGAGAPPSEASNSEELRTGLKGPTTPAARVRPTAQPARSRERRSGKLRHYPDLGIHSLSPR